MFYNYLLTISPCGAAGQLPVAHTGTTTGRCSTNLRFRCRRVIAALSFVFFLSIGQASASADGSIKPGARGEILTALAPGRPTRIGIEILGWIEGTGPGRSLIIGQLMNTDIGVLSGMSGSPVYIDGVLIGALSQAFPFARTPVCAITPMSDMETVWAGAAEVGGAGRVAGSRIFSTEFPTNNKSSGLFSLRHGLSAGLAQPLIALLGFTAADAELAPQLSGIPIGSLSGISASSPRDGTAKLEPGAAVTIPLVLGDREISALGTITQINGEQILAFGHGFLELGVCSLPLGAGNIVATVPNYQIGFKIGSSVGQIGEVLIDHPCGIGARLGKPPEMTEMKLSPQSRKSKNEPLSKKGLCFKVPGVRS